MRLVRKRYRGNMNNYQGQLEFHLRYAITQL